MLEFRTVRRQSVRSVAGFALFSAVTLFAAQGVAQPSDEVSAREPENPPVRNWYGWQTLAVDGLADGFMAIGLATDEQSFVNAWLISFPLGTPLIHAFHRNPMGTGVSLALRVGFPVIGALFGSLGENPFDTCFNPTADIPGGPEPEPTLCPSKASLVGAAVGGLLVTGLDAGFLAFDDRGPAERQSASFENAIRVSPRLVLQKDTVGLGFVGGF